MPPAGSYPAHGTYLHFVEPAIAAAPLAQHLRAASRVEVAAATLRLAQRDTLAAAIRQVEKF